MENWKLDGLAFDFSWNWLLKLRSLVLTYGKHCLAINHRMAKHNEIGNGTSESVNDVALYIP